MVPRLSSGAIQKILNGEEVSQPVIQLLGYKKVPGDGLDRYRLLISDGQVVSTLAMLSTQLNHMVSNKELEKYTVIQIDRFKCEVLTSEKKVIVLLAVSVVEPGAHVGSRIGNPVTANTSDGAPACKKEKLDEPLLAASTQFMSNQNFSEFTTGNMREDSASSSSSRASKFYGATSSNILPINSLTPYQNKWTIRGRVTAKTAIKTWSNSRGEGKLFSVNILDESGEIRATAFQEAVDQFFDLLEMNKLYYISRATLRRANKQFTSVKNEYEMNLTSNTTIVPCVENVSNIPLQRFDFVPIRQIEQVEANSIVDVIGICKLTGKLQTVLTRNTNREIEKRELQIVDASSGEVDLTLWGEEARAFDGSCNPVVVVKGVRVSNFNGRSLSTISSSTLQVNPDISEVSVLKAWYEMEGFLSETHCITSRAGSFSRGVCWKTLFQVGEEKLGMGDKQDYFTTKATVVHVRNCMYMACPKGECKKKVDVNNGMYQCNKCSAEYPEFRWRLVLSLCIADFTETIWVTCFEETAEAILGVRGRNFLELKETDAEKFDEILNETNFTSFVFKLRTKMNMFNEESQLQTTVLSADPIEPTAYGRKLLNDIKQIVKML